jgi:hypothetical protein
VNGSKRALGVSLASRSTSDKASVKFDAVATPPRITAAERGAAIARIDRRHARIDDPRRSEIGIEARDVLGFMLGRGPPGVPRRVSAAGHALDPRHRLHATLRELDALRARFAPLG